MPDRRSSAVVPAEPSGQRPPAARDLLCRFTPRASSYGPSSFRTASFVIQSVRIGTASFFFAVSRSTCA